MSMYDQGRLMMSGLMAVMAALLVIAIAGAQLQSAAKKPAKRTTPKAAASVQDDRAKDRYQKLCENIEKLIRAIDRDTKRPNEEASN